MKATLLFTGLIFCLNQLQAQYYQDYSIRRKTANQQLAWQNTDNYDKTVIHNRYDLAVGNGTPILLTTYSPDQYAAMPEITANGKKQAEHTMEIRSRKGTVLLTLNSSQRITIQSLLQGKIHNQEFFSNFVIDQSADAAVIDMNRQLLRQVLALHFSRQIQQNQLLNDFRLEYGKWLVSQKTEPRIVDESKLLQPCGTGNLATSIYSWKIPAGLEALLGEDNTVEALSDLAVEVLAGKKSLNKNELADVSNAIRIVNEAFEEGRYLVGWSQQFITCSNSWILRWKMLTPVQELPFGADAYSTETLVDSSGETALVVKALTSSRVLVELYTGKGSRIEKLCHQHLDEGTTVRFPIKTGAKADRLVYKVTADGRTYSGLIP